MKLALFDDWRVGVVDSCAHTITDVTEVVPGTHDTDHLGASWWVRMCRDFEMLRRSLERAARDGTARRLGDVRLRAPVLNPGKVIATASNYGEHVAEMREVVLERVAGHVDRWLLDFDVFLKATSSIVGPDDAVVLPAGPEAEGREVHHESELAVVMARGGSGIDAAHALDHVLGYTIGLDMTLRGDGDRSRRKSYDTFTPIGPWLVTADEIADPNKLEVRLQVDGVTRQDAKTADMLVDVAGIIAYTSAIMRLDPGDIILTGAPPGVGQVQAGEVMISEISEIGTMRNPMRAPNVEVTK
ncbi:MAG TPA: fumarylacetoacetate hydrolase family protein [Acidimicrobiales bacterium]|nr:fumarylacetoacetate hydrolase family protein [Acidimicrobiales bacterium]